MTNSKNNFNLAYLINQITLITETLDDDTDISFPETGYYLPTIYAFSRMKIQTISDIKKFIANIQSIDIGFFENIADLDNLKLLFLMEIFESIQSKTNNQYKSGFIPDSVFRKLGVPLVDGSILGISLIIGRLNEGKEIENIVKNLQRRSILVLLVGDVIEQLESVNFPLGLENKVIPLGKEITKVIHAFNLIIRIALSFGGVELGNTSRLLAYITEKLPVFVLLLGEINKFALDIAKGAITCGIPIISDQNTSIETNFGSEPDHSKIVDFALETRGIKVKIENIPIPIEYGYAFEGQKVRKPDVYVEFGGGLTKAFELLVMEPQDEITDGLISVQGKDIEQLEPGSLLPLGIIVEVSGKEFQSDFEPVLERQIHHYINHGDGLWHNAQRNIVWIRINKDAISKGFKIKHIGDIIYSKLHQDFAQIIDKVQVKIFTDQKNVDNLLPIAIEEYQKRDDRIKELTDQSIDIFYSCLLCQSFAPNHVCIITPERAGLCGAVNWLDAKTSYEINPTGGNQPVEKGELLDSAYGSWKKVNNFVDQKSHGTITKVNLYSLMEYPLTSCGCFECIAAVLPETNGIMIVNREYLGDTPLGMSFSTLASSVGGGSQTPGFMGLSKNFIVSKKFLLAEGGIKRIVWMPKELKEYLGEKIENLEPSLLNKIASEENSLTITDLENFLHVNNHPVLEMDPILR